MRRIIVILMLALAAVACRGGDPEQTRPVPYGAPTPDIFTLTDGLAGSTRIWHGSIDGVECITVNGGISCDFESR